MTNKEKRADFLLHLEIAIAAILFFAMLICCGLYIDIKMNGRTSNLPTLSETDTRLLFSSSEAQNKTSSDDLLEPLFIGFKNNDEMLCVVPDNEQRRLSENALFGTLKSLFRGKSEFVGSEPEDRRNNVEDIKNYERYILIGFFDNLPSEVILPCISGGLDAETDTEGFFFRYLFVVPDSEGNISALAVSSDNDVTVLTPSEKISFNNFFDETYDINEGKIPFVYTREGSVSPAYASSFTSHKYKVIPYAERDGMSVDSAWLKRVFDAFSVNPNLVKSFTSGDGSEVNYVEEFRELVVNVDGSVEYKDPDGVGAGLDEFMGYISMDSSDYSFSDKVFALKNLINTVYGDSDNVSHSLVGIDYIESTDSLKLYFKYTVDGMFIFENDFDAVFEIKDNMLVYAYMLFFECSAQEGKSIALPQRYAFAVASEKGVEEIYPVLCDSDVDGVREFCWAALNKISEVNG